MSRPACSAYRWLRFSVVNSFVPLCCWALCCCAQALANAPSQASPAVPAPTQQLGPVAELSLTAAGAQGSPAPLRGQDAQSQLVVTAK
ncbi:MAG: hypothetical protein J0M17_18425, partial [Planctomycetes bacterium]|nr:hypothetical protein [Planctomycetota bacterium]